ncbi:aminotransferase class V-fold PLP-dependent enzyme [Sphingosinicella soli]|uniref:Selenocysteine lyase/cysteine desulfurase n=1 Tax=Sphingosinicella soli TaxID=333708 RepID=A0A7W7B567_9SPHN|nr:aminotransferase class V-fold PLP-dependent enzyme [Sphingosinicella soli]MBB4633330.1 selenocysteine lyase/cysteine desulfurase [Sphingosinicella soli]
MSIIPCQRDRFEIPRDVAYLNCAYMSPLARDVTEAINKGAALKTAPWTYTPADFFAHTEALRTRFAALAGGRPDDFALVPSVSYGLAVAARNLPLRPGQEIIVLADQFPSNLYVWREHATAQGARIVTVTRGDGEAWTPAVLAAIGPDTGIVAVPNCHWADGGFVDLDAVGAACRKAGAALALDLTQSIGALPFDAGRVQPDFMVAACYKWGMGPYGTAMLYVAPKHQGGTPIEHNWMNRGGSEDFSRLVDYRDDFQPGARRFDMGEKSNPPQVMGAAAAIDMLIGWGVANIAETLGARNLALGEAARGIGLLAPDPATRAPHFLSLGFPGDVPAGLPERLARENVFVSLRGRSLRVTPHLYNDDTDCDRLIAVLQKALR